jgi:Ni/Co efflux regulator RcnB
MKFFSCLFIALALLGTSTLVLAERGHHDQDRRGQRHGQRDHHQDRRQVERRHVDYRGHDGHRYNRHGDRRQDHHRDYRRYGYRPVYPHYRHARWERGHRYNGPIYVVRDYGYYRLRPPPRGYRWVRADNDFLLVAISTGIILDLALR